MNRPTQRPRKPNSDPVPGGAPLRLSSLEEIAAEARADDRILKRTFAVAGVLHLILLAWQLPIADAAVVVDPTPPRVVTVLKATRFKEPTVDIEPPKELEPVVRLEPMPDPDPTDPEVIREWNEPPPALTVPATDIAWNIPAEPPPFTDAPIYVTGEVVAPQKLHAPTPLYPEMARRIKLEGLAIVEAIIEVDGMVTNVRVLRDPGMGLGDAAATTIREWRFAPATLSGRPVAVYYTLTVNFSIEG